MRTKRGAGMEEGMGGKEADVGYLGKRRTNWCKRGFWDSQGERIYRVVLFEAETQEFVWLRERERDNLEEKEREDTLRK